MNVASYVVRAQSSRLVKAGLLLFLVGCGPLLAIIALASLGLTSDPNPNPIGPGLLAFFSFWPSIALIVAGLAASIRDGSASRP